MEGKTHLFCALMYFGAALFAAYKAGAVDAYSSLLFFLAAFEGVLLPDIDANKSLITKIKLTGILKFVAFLAKTIAYATKFVLYLFLKLILFFYGKKDRHRGVMHSFKGLISVCVFWLLIGYLALDYFHAMKYFKDLLLIVLGLLFGYAMHLWHDSLTVAGVAFTSKFKLHGWLKTGRHEFLLQMFFLVISAFSAYLTNSTGYLYGGAILAISIPLSYLFFGRT
ncbi:MAG: metal-dependent hydrolase [Candidatus Micrarchaeota archaeon]